MLNYIWGGLIVFSLIFALVNDASDIVNDTWRNGEEFSVELLFPANADLNRNQNIRFTMDGGESVFNARWYPVDEEAELIIAVQDGLPEHWLAVAQNQSSNRRQEIRAYVATFALRDGTGLDELLDGEASTGHTPDSGLPGYTDEARDSHGAGLQPESIVDEGIASALDEEVTNRAASDATGQSAGVNGASSGGSGSVTGGFTAQASLTLPEVHFVKLRAITSAAFDMAEFAVTLALGLVGIMALWLGLMKIAEQAGLIYVVVKGVRPFMRWLFPELPKDHPAMGMISLNLAANVLGLGNAATPLGIKAMEELQKLNPEKDTATNSMIMFLALNTSSVQLLPPVTLVAIMGLRVNELMVAITLTTIFSTMAAIIAAKLYARRYPPVLSATGELLAVGSDSDGAAKLRALEAGPDADGSGIQSGIPGTGKPGSGTTSGGTGAGKPGSGTRSGDGDGQGPGGGTTSGEADDNGTNETPKDDKR